MNLPATVLALVMHMHSSIYSYTINHAYTHAHYGPWQRKWRGCGDSGTAFTVDQGIVFTLDHGIVIWYWRWTDL